MIQYKQPKKTKGARKKARQEVLERLLLKYPTWFEGKTDQEIIDLIVAFRRSKKDDDEFPNFCIRYEAEIEEMNKMIRNNAINMMTEYNKHFYELTSVIGMRDATPGEKQSIQDEIDAISVPTDVNFNDFFKDPEFLERCESMVNEICGDQKKF